jgi:KaiC/GvpD/RAD55 family RecA-like ATPase
MESTGIEALDKILGGGLPRPSTIAITGPMRSGKSVLAKQIVANMLKDESCCCLYYAVDHPADEVREGLKSIGLAVEECEKKGTFYFVDVFALGVQQVSERIEKSEPRSSVIGSGLRFPDIIDMGRAYAMKNLRKKQLWILDSITTLFLMHDRKETFQYLQTIRYITRFFHTIGIAINHTGVFDEKVENAYYGFADVLIELKKSDVAQLEFLSGMLSAQCTRQNFLRGNFYYEIKDNQMNISLMPI